MSIDEAIAGKAGKSCKASESATSKAIDFLLIKILLH
jgi:hypothetical protein